MEKGYGFWLCHTTKKLDGLKIVVDCHTKYHVEKKLFESKSTGSATTGSSVVSDLTEEQKFYQLSYCPCLKGII
jgi:hypothetical protein